MADEIRHDVATPVYRQLADILRARIASGQYGPGQQIPSETEIELEFGLARGTIKKAVQVLRAQGLVVTVRGKGTFVVPRGERDDGQGDD